MKELNYAEIDPGDEPPEPQKNKFIKAEERKKQLDEEMNPEKHLLPKDFYTTTKPRRKHEDGFKLPWHAIDIIFNHKGIWSNLQNSDPAKIKYHIHKTEDWLALIQDPLPTDIHPREAERDLL